MQILSLNIRCSKQWLFFLLMTLLLTACGSKDNTEPPAPLANFTPSLTPKVLWSVSTGANSKNKYLKLTPAFNHEHIITVSANGLVKALKMDSGSSIWENQLELSISAGPGSSDNLIVLGGSRGEVIALETGNGTKRWQTQVSSEILSPPAVDSNIVVVRTVDGKLFSFDAQTGNQLWVYEARTPTLTLRGTSAPLIADNLVLAGFDNGMLVALDLPTGKLTWESRIVLPTGRTELERMVDIDADLKRVDDTIYVVTFQGRVAAISLLSGEIFWEREISSYAGLAVDSKLLCVSDSNGHLVAYDTNGASLWKQTQLQARNLSAPAIMGDYVIVGDREGHVHWIRAEDGAFAARYAAAGSVSAPPLVFNNTVFIHSDNGELTALTTAVSR